MGTMLQERKTTTTSRREVDDAVADGARAARLRAARRDAALRADRRDAGARPVVAVGGDPAPRGEARRRPARADVPAREPDRGGHAAAARWPGRSCAAWSRARSAAAATPVATGTLRIGIEGPGLAELNGPVLAAVADRHPRARLIVRESLGLPQAFFDQRLDLALVRTPPDDALDVHPVATEERGLLVPPDHPAARAGGGRDGRRRGRALRGGRAARRRDARPLAGARRARRAPPGDRRRGAHHAGGDRRGRPPPAC